ncbi:hypothetical protein PASE110613_00300 [Paenibacillus sediminis]|uniref:Photosystem II stability/assembly factor-like uncharacterized protein n=1 Tax=Paenibacillus sediminis TaxID=664909 RepID=A0ABS4H1J3_9BACL|nr:hypothetical protein [Paenibacillus sediminis]MBP1935980.1 photosystem II stability/assembly factor-like uncharacterized protein [Paenibacillus sediminis]
MKWWFKLLGAMLIVLVLLSACSSNKTDAPLVRQEDEALDEGQTLTVVTPEPSKQNEQQSKYQIQTKLTDFHLFSDHSGLAWGVTRNALRLYVTEDDGKEWTDISPAASVQFPSVPEYGKTLFFLDRQNGWIIRNALGTSESVVLHTTDGGLHWKITSLPNSTNVIAIDFVSLKRGWVMTSADSAMGRQEKALLRTNDGGSIWKKTMQNTGYFKAEAPTLYAIPQTGYLVGMTFTNNVRGFALTMEMRSPRLYKTEDGGRTWTSISSFESEPSLQTCDALQVRSPQLWDSEGVKGLITVGCKRGDETKFINFVTSDSGVHWNNANISLGWQSGVNEEVPPTFLNEMEGWYIEQGAVYHTVNQGLIWTILPESRILKDRIADYPSIVKLQFISSNVGWLLIENAEKKRSLLLQTRDGGFSWKVL